MTDTPTTQPTYLGIILTPAANKQMLNALNERQKGIGIRVAIKTTGCSGLAYVLEFADEIQAEDQVFDQDGIQIVVDLKSLVYIDGTVMDYVHDGINEGFKFTNPKTKGECGCGESFTV